MAKKLKQALIYLIVSYLILNPVDNIQNLDYFDHAIFLYLLILYLLILLENHFYIILVIPIIIVCIYGLFLFPIKFAYYILVLLLLLTLSLNVSLAIIIKEFNKIKNYSYRQYLSFINAEHKINSNRKIRLPLEANAGLVVGSLAVQKALHFHLPGLGFLVKPFITALFGVMDPPYNDSRLNDELRKLVIIISDNESLLLKIYLILFIIIPAIGIIITLIYDFSYIEHYLLNSQLKDVLKSLWDLT